MKLRDHLAALLAGTQPAARGNVLTPAALESSAPFATACQRLVLAAYARDSGERVSAPAESLQPLP